MSESSAALAPTPAGPRHGLRIVTTWAIATAIVVPVTIWVVVPHIPPGSMSQQARDQHDVNVALTATQPAIVTVTLRNASGTVIATNSNRVPVGVTTVPVPLAAEPPGSASAPTDQQDEVDLSVDHPGVSVEAQAPGVPFVQAVRPPASSDGVRLAYAGNGLGPWGHSPPGGR